MFKRKLLLPKNNLENFFLWGARQTGKTTLLKQSYPDALWIDLLKSDDYRRYTGNPELLRKELEAKKHRGRIVIDEIQKVPKLLDEVHWLIENGECSFALCGSSARKVKRGGANLLGGRAIRYELFGLTSFEAGNDFNLNRFINNGYIPRHYTSSRPTRLLQSYIGDYLKEEIAAESTVRNLPAFSRFLDIAALSDTELINFSIIARECGVSSHTVKEYFQILTDTLLGQWVPAYTKKPKRRIVKMPKFYFFDVGIVNVLAKRGFLEQGSPLFGKAFENLIFHELRAYSHYSEAFFDIAYWRLTSGVEVDFILNNMEVAIEVKASQKITSDHLKGLRNLRRDYPDAGKGIIVSLESKARYEGDILVLPVWEFIELLWNGEIIG